MHDIELLAALYIVAAPIFTYQAWLRTTHSTKERRILIRTLTTGFLFTPGVIGIGHGIGLCPAWVGALEGLFYIGENVGPGLFFGNGILLICGLLFALKLARSAEKRKNGSHGRTT